MQLPPIGVWTRMELTQEFDDNAEKYFCSLFMAGVAVIKEYAEDWNLASHGVKDGDVYIMVGEEDVLIPGTIREAPLRKTQGLFGHCPNSDCTPFTQTGTVGHFISGPT